jgi:hypothetical protein
MVERTAAGEALSSPQPPEAGARRARLGETGTFGVSSAIANAIHDAVGVRLTELPITAEAVYRALRRAAALSLRLCSAYLQGCMTIASWL